MATYFVGDIQGCFDELRLLLDKVDFRPSRDELWVVGDMVARGEKSLETLRYLKSLEHSAKVVLGNHDLHLLAVHAQLKRPKPSDNLSALLAADDIEQLIDWIRVQPLIRELKQPKLLMSHAGIPPQWDVETALAQASLVSQALQSPDYLEQLISKMYGNDVTQWSIDLSATKQLIYCINALTRMRYLHNDGSLDFDCKLPPNKDIHDGLTPWFTHNNLANQTHQLVFGHWAALMGKVDNPAMRALDTGCCWGEYLTLWHLESDQKITQNKLKKS
ncbi:bis(5'-nucleosyl)-tetraphosphatase (symmetrical) [Shewanella colwelliana]|uniref:Bis(5'-nucleosyl)-tetraphosphatase, symmetrical n=1 Tax=Shewanella colwelliana TaxID=23 RepID=A0A1E5IPZ0_SHECO|nr:symmetrical bis(5'-nucleosyl)-tetraphosphatase [Shewanella colwelliana]OEG72632.1 bis(5'-nucleosyl)-tetraphosphatase (symmetrical) [Shewanella colwelliana]